MEYDCASCEAQICRDGADCFGLAEEAVIMVVAGILMMTLALSAFSHQE